MGKVYIAQEATRRDRETGITVPRFDVTPALVYGEIEFLIPAVASVIVTGPMVATLKNKLRNFTEEDYILPAGDPIIIAMAAMIAADNNMGRVKMLRWDKPTRSYMVIQIDKRGVK